MSIYATVRRAVRQVLACTFVGAVTAGGSATLALVAGAGGAEAKTPGQSYCFLGVCHRVKTLAETRALVGRTEVLQASYYYEAGRDRFNPSNITSSGEYFHASRPDNAASPILPNGTKLLVWHPITKQAVVVRINNAGPYWGRRTLDLSRAAAERLGMIRSGVGTVMTRVIEAPSPVEATYRRGRSYAPVPGFLGQFASIDLAQQTAARSMGRPVIGTPGVAVALAIEPDALAPPPELGEYVVARRSDAVTTLVIASVANPTLVAAKPTPARSAASKAGDKPATIKVAATKVAGPVVKAAALPRPTVAPQVRLAQVNQPANVRVASLPKRAPAAEDAAAAAETPSDAQADSRWVSRVLLLQREH